MTTEAKTRNQLDGEIIKIRRGLAIYKVRMSPYYKVRMRNPKTRKYAVKSSKETSRIKAREVAEELYEDFLNGGAAKSAPKQFTFEKYANDYLELCQDYVNQGVRNPAYYKDAKAALLTSGYGALKYFKNYDVREITTAHWNDYLKTLRNAKRGLSKSTIANITSHFRNTLKQAMNDGAIPAIIHTPKPEAASPTQRPFFRFTPIVEKRVDQYRLVNETIKQIATEPVKVRGVTLDYEFLDLVQFLTNSFLRPTASELYALKHADVVIEKSGKTKALRLNIRKGKTGARICTTMEAAVGIYERIKKRYPNHDADDYLFYPQYRNRSHAVRVGMNLLNYTLTRANLEIDPYTNMKHTMYSFRHTAICMRLVLSKGKINVYTLAKNAGTSVEMIEKNYARRLPIVGDLVDNLQSFGD